MFKHHRFITSLLLFSLYVVSFADNALNYDVVATEISQQEYNDAFKHFDEYNQKADSTIVNTATKQSIINQVANSLEGWWRDFYESDDVGIYFQGLFPGTGEYYFLVYGPSEEEARFVGGDKKSISIQLKGSHDGVYSYNNIYAGYQTADCDERVIINFYDTPKPGEKRLIAYYQNDWMVYDYSLSTPAMFWYKGDLYCRWLYQGLDADYTDNDSRRHWYKLQLR